MCDAGRGWWCCQSPLAGRQQSEALLPAQQSSDGLLATGNRKRNPRKWQPRQPVLKLQLPMLLCGVVVAGGPASKLGKVRLAGFSFPKTYHPFLIPVEGGIHSASNLPYPSFQAV
jgi:hypothetical protein